VNIICDGPIQAGSRYTSLRERFTLDLVRMCLYSRILKLRKEGEKKEGSKLYIHSYIIVAWQLKRSHYIILN
jgi:hypothetical protein